MQQKEMEKEKFSPRNFLVSEGAYGMIGKSIDLQKEALTPLLQSF
jgi:hypothetical protein